MSTVAGNGPTTTAPEETYKTATTPAARRRIQTAVVIAYREKIQGAVRRLLPRSPQHWEEACQVGALGLLVALEKYQPKPGAKPWAFWRFACLPVMSEIREWMGVGVYWRKPANRGKSPERAAQRVAAKLQELHGSLDAEIRGTAETLHDRVFDEVSPLQEALVGDAEAAARLATFVRTIAPEDAAVLLTEDHRQVNSRHHKALVERARAFVIGSESGGHSEPVSRHSVEARADAPAAARSVSR